MKAVTCSLKRQFETSRRRRLGEYLHSDVAGANKPLLILLVFLQK